MNLNLFGDNMKLKLISTLFILIILTACDRDTSVIKPEVKIYKNFMPLNVGNFWVYLVYEIDINGNKINDSKRIDSAVVTEFLEKTTIVSGTPYKVNAYKVNIFSDGNFIQSEYYYIKDNYLYILRDKNNFIINEFEPIWTKLIDQNSSKWNSFQYSNDDYSLQFKNQSYKSNYEVTINSQFVYSYVKNSDFGEIYVSQFQEFIDTRTLFDYNNINAVKFYKNNIFYDYADSIGLIYYYSKPTSEIFVPLNSDPNFPTTIINVNGLEKTLINYKVNF